MSQNLGSVPQGGARRLDDIKSKNRQVNELTQLNLRLEASVVQLLSHLPGKPGVAGSISGFSNLSDETISRGPVSI